MELNRELEKLLKKVEKPARYIGEEINSIKKEHADVRFGFAFPDTYEIGMSYLGLQLLYNILNKEENIACERVFSPAPDMEALMRQADMPLFTLETKTPLNELDILGFTLQYEMSYTNILNILNLGKIPALCYKALLKLCRLPLQISSGWLLCGLFLWFHRFRKTIPYVSLQ